MSFDKNYPNRKDHRKQYAKRGRSSKSCRPHGGCPYCLNSRLHNSIKKKLSADEQLKEENEK